MKMKENGKIRLPIFLPVSLIIAALLVTFIIGIIWFQNRHVTQQAQETFDKTQKMFDEYLKKDATMMSGMIDFIERDESLQQIWFTKNRDKLFQYADSIFQDIRNKYRITHFYFVGTDGICFLRVHDSAEYGDKINRFTMIEAMRQGKPVYGIELGKFGTFTLRVVHPWHIDGKLVGYIELGEEIEHTSPIIEQTLGVNLQFVIKKSLLDQTTWEAGLKMMGKSGDWDLMHEYVIIDSTPKPVSPKLIQNLKLSHNEHKDVIFESSIDKHQYYNGLVQLLDAAGRDVGHIIITKDITKNKAIKNLLMLTMILVSIPVCVCLLWIIRFYLCRIENNLSIAYSDLQNEIDKREIAEQKLRESYYKVEQEVKIRTSELQTANKQLIQEVSERKKAEETLASLNNELEATITELMVTNRQLADFAFIAAHDLKTPLRAIGTLTEWLATDYADKFDHEGKRRISLLINRTERMSKLIDSILIYAKAGHTVTTQEMVDINLLLKEVIYTVNPPRNIPITIETKMPVLIREKNAITQIFQNLLNNAVLYMDKVNGEIKISCVEEKGFWKFNVEDNGPGIEKAYHEKIFKMFQVLSSGYKNQNTGIGLAIVRKIVEGYHGKIWVESTPGKGSSFYFTLPKQESEVIEDAQFQTNFVS